ncbi:MAG: sorting and assembly machinery component 50 [Chlorobiaceae bacterium]|nr:sorting and assembly machinery component 50 [Chlorobiaceae bacterium]
MLRAENSPPAPSDKLSSRPVVKSFRVTGNKALSTEELREIMSTSTRNSFLGTGLFSGAPRYFINEEFVKDVSLIRKLYTFKGYFFTRIDSTVVRNKKGDVRITLKITENQPTRIDSVRYAGLESVPEEIRNRYLRRSSIKTGQIFTVENLVDEKERSLDFFRENGYTFFNPDSIGITVDTLGLKAGINIKLKLSVRHTYGPVKVIVHDPLNKDNPATARTFTRNNVTVTIYGDQKFSPKLFPSSIAWNQGELTRQSLEQNTLENYGTSNLFSSISMERDTVSTGDALAMTINLEPSPKHQIEPKLLMDNRYGSLFLGGALAYENRNLFGAGQLLKLSTNYGTQTSANTNLLSNLTSDQYDRIIPHDFNIKASLVMPKLGKQGSFYTGTMEFAQSKQPVLLTNQREIFRGTYSTRPSKNSRLNFDFFELEVVRKDSLRGFQQLFKTDLAKNIGIDPLNPGAVKNGIDSLLQTRLNQTFRLQYNYSNQRNTTYQKSTAWNFSAAAEESGSLLWFIDQYLDKRAYLGFNDQDPQIFGTSYNQYVKIDMQMAFTRNLSPDKQIAGRIALGWMSPYGKAQTTPEDHRFYAGGSNSMRAWLFGTLGPGNCSSSAISNFGADIKTEYSLEYRLKFFKIFGQRSGIAVFTDAGNIWDRKGPYAFSMQSLTRDFAWDWGTGLRIGSPIGPFRFDFAWKIHDPANPHSWRFSNTKLSDFTFNFGIGEPY